MKLVGSKGSFLLSFSQEDFPVVAPRFFSADSLFTLVRAGFERIPDRRAEKLSRKKAEHLPNIQEQEEILSLPVTPTPILTLLD